MDHFYPYIASLTREPFLFYGMRSTKAGKRPKHENEDPIRSGIEAMEICNFSCRKRTAKIKPLLKMTGAYCLFCGVKNYEIE